MTDRRLLIRGGIVFPFDGSRRALDPGSVLVEGREIVAVGSVEELDVDPRAASATVHDASGHAVLPGLHNCHLHSGLLRGTAESKSLWEWLRDYVDPAHRVLTPEIAEAASLLAYTESILAGTTSVMDMWRFMDGSARVAERVGIRATLVPYVADMPGYDYFETLDTNRALLEEHRDSADGRVRAWVGIEHLLYCTEEACRNAVALAEEFETGLHTHSSETTYEVEQSLERFGRRPIAEFEHRGMLGPRTVVAHCVWIDAAEIEALSRTGTGVAHCPCSNMKLSSGPAPVGALRRAGVRLGIGSDGEKENNTLDLFDEIKFASLLEKVTTLDPTTGDPWDVLEMATCGGARVLNLESVTGSLVPGKRADIITVALDGLHTTPVLHGRDFNVAAHLAFSSSGADVRDVWVDGKHLVANRAPRFASVEEVRATAQAAAEELFERRAALAPAPSP